MGAPDTATQAHPAFSLRDRLELDEGRIFVTGVQALVRIPLMQRRADLSRGHNSAGFISGYPGSPIGGLDLELARQHRLLADHEIVHRMGVNEELAATAVMGSQLLGRFPDPKFDGVVGYWYGKANGFDRAMDSIRQANLCGTLRTGGAVAIVGDDPTAKSSPTPGASEMAAAAVMMPMLYPGDVQEVLDLGLHAVAMSRCTGLWTALKVATSVADGSGTAYVGPERVTPRMVDATLDGRPYLHIPTTHLHGQSVLGMERSMVYARMEAALEYARVNDLNRITVRTDHDRIGIIASGKTWFDLRQALRELGLDDDRLRRLGVRLLQLRMPYPLEGRIVREFADGLTDILVLEDKRPFVELFVKDELYNLPSHPLVLGKLDEHGKHLVPIHHELDAPSIARLVVDHLRRVHDLSHDPSLDLPDVDAALRRLTSPVQRTPLPLSRKPYFCSGCPHNSSVANVGKDEIIGGGTGCHVLAVYMRPEMVGDVIGITAMGNEGAQWVGAAPFTGLPHLIQNMGDGTYAHSGILAIRATLTAGVNVTYRLLYNDHVAMTGAQPAVGIRPVPDLATVLLAEGVARVIITTEDVDRYAGVRLPAGAQVWHRDRIVEAQDLLRDIPGVTVLIHDQECAAEKRRRRKRGTLDDPPKRVLINERVCEGCGDCGVQSNCLSVHPVDTEFGRKTQIHQPSCNKDYSCLKGNCPSFLTILPAGATPARAQVVPVGADALPEPQVRVRADEFGMRITGIGGSGVVTVAQTLAVAAVLDGLHVRGMDQTGLAQKGGPVVSDLKFTTEPIDQTNKLTAADCDLYLACDPLVGAEPVNLVVADVERTIGVVSTAMVPTGDQIADVSARFPAMDLLVERILTAGRRTDGLAIDAPGSAERLFGTDQVANMLLVGVAHQAGALPLSAGAIEEAIGHNGVSVELNTQAFRRGRQFVADPEGFARALESTSPVRESAVVPDPTPAALAVAATVRSAGAEELARIVAVRSEDLLGYQDEAYARRYAALVESVRSAEDRAVPGSTALAEGVARSLHKLMAYKDEYEVARLHLLGDPSAEVRGRFGADTAYRFQLQPPILKAMGIDRKISVPGSVGVAAFRVLAKGKRLRGSRFDVFGRDHIRATERELVREFETVLGEVVGALTAENHAVAVELVGLPDLVRGYDTVKMGNVARYREALARLRPTFTPR